MPPHDMQTTSTKHTTSMPQHQPPGCLLAIFKLFGIARSNGTAAEPEALPYRRNNYLLSKAERSFFGVLQTAAGEQYLIFAKVRLADLIYIPRGTDSRQTHFNRIQSKHIDFVLCDPKSVRPMVAVELDDASHEQAARVARDSFVDAALAAAGLPLLRVPARAGYSVEELARSIQNLVPDLPPPLNQGKSPDH